MGWVWPARLVRVAIIAGVVVAAATCVRDDLESCAGDILCPRGTRCVAIAEFSTTTCVAPTQIEACTGVAPGAACELDGTLGTCFGGACLPPVCGDAIRDLSELCDDGNRTAGDGCSSNCLSSERCGDGVTDLAAGEQCDDAAAGLTGDGCTSRCTLEYQLWRDVTPGRPPGRSYAELAADPAGGVMLFGGTPGSGSNILESTVANAQNLTTLDETWHWDGTSWLRRHPATSPSRRILFSMSYDPARRRVVLFGGLGPSGVILDDTWEWDGVTWTERTPAVKPPARVGASLACAPARCVLSGGATGTGFPLTYFADTWAWDGVTWTLLAGSVSPPRARAALAYDAEVDRFVLFGGEQGSATYGDTWLLGAAGSWGQLGSAAAGPPAPYSGTPASSAFDRAARQTVMVTTSQTWRLTLNGSGSSDPAWSGPSGGPALDGARVAFDEGRARMVAYGTTAGALSTLSEGTGPGSIWNTRVELVPSNTGARGVTAAYDARRGATIVFEPLTGTWAWNGVGWRLVAAVAAGPPQSDATALAYDAVCGETVAFGGRRVNQTAHDETWIFDGTWRQHLEGPHPPARSGHTMTFDATRGTLLLFGGAMTPQVLLADVWEWQGSCGARSWRQLSPLAGPSPRTGSTLAFDARAGTSLLFGGRDAAGDHADTWTFDGVAWTALAPAVSPGARSDHALAYDPRRGQLVLFGGRLGVARFADTWAWDGGAQTWHQLSTVTSPSPRSGATMVPDATGGLIILGGLSDSGTQLRDVHRLQSELALQPPERCAIATADTDGDGLAGCDDPDCWLRCAPLCAPGTSCAGHHCGDGTCSPVEDYLICPLDCAAPL